MNDNNLFNFSLIREAEIPEGQYQYQIKDIQIEHNVLTNYGAKQKIGFFFDITIDDVKKEFSKSFYYSKYPESRFMKFMMIICKAYNKNKFNLQELIGTTGILTIKHGKDEQGNVYENITAIKPNKQEEQENLNF